MMNNRRIRSFHGIEIYSATTMRAFTCGFSDCKNAHLVGFDDNGLPFCEIVMSSKMLRDALAVADREVIGASIISFQNPKGSGNDK